MNAATVPRGHADLIRIGYADLPDVDAIEQRAYVFPWTLGNLRDSLDAGHLFVGLSTSEELVAYAILMSVIDEAHLLNLTVAPEHQGQGWGGDMLRECLRLAATEMQARSILLEVRPSNVPALALYQRAGFRSVGRRRAYYPAPVGREDALVLRRMLP